VHIVHNEEGFDMKSGNEDRWNKKLTESDILDFCKKELQKCSTNRKELKEKLLKIDTLRQFKHELNQLVSIDSHGQNFTWTSTSCFFKGSRLRITLMKLADDIATAEQDMKAVSRAEEVSLQETKGSVEKERRPQIVDDKESVSKEKIKQLLEPIFPYVADTRPFTNYMRLDTRIRDIEEITPSELSNLFYYQLGLLVSILSVRCKVLQSGAEQVEILDNLLIFICKKLGGIYGSEDLFNKHTGSSEFEILVQRYLKIFSPQLNSSIISYFPEIFKNNSVIIDIHEEYNIAFEFNRNPYLLIEDHLKKFSDQFNNIISISVAPPIVPLEQPSIAARSFEKR
jgi:hypothetical protein